MDSENKAVAAGRGKSKLKPWRKNVYENKGYKDNYTDASFLEEMQRNINFQEVHYSTAFIGAGLLTQQFCIVVLFSLVFVVMDFGWIEPNCVLYLCGLATTIGYTSRFFLLPRLENICTDKAKKSYSGDLILTDFVTVVKCLALGHILSPVLKTLTETISTDTIQAAALIAFTVHVATYDFGIGNDPGIPYRSKMYPSPRKSHMNAPSHWSSKVAPNVNKKGAKEIEVGLKPVTKEQREFNHCPGEKSAGKDGRTTPVYIYSSRTSSALSLNAAIFGALCLASRLASPLHAFALLSTAGLAFALGPPYLKLLHRWPPARIFVPLFFFSSAAYSLFCCCGGLDTDGDWMINQIPLAMFLLVVLFLNVLCPVMFVRWQAYKDNIYGPWDEAVPVIPHSSRDDEHGNM